MCNLCFSYDPGEMSPKTHVSRMKEEFPIHSAQFFTAIIYEFKPALAEDIYKDIIINSLQFLVREKRI